METNYNQKKLYISDKSLDAGVVLIKERAASIWQRPLIRHYTEHGIKHSENIIRIVDKLLENSQIILNNYEIFILLSSIYLHDIGMQLSRTDGLEEGKILRNLDEMEFIRGYHNDLSHDMILDSVIQGGFCPSLALENYLDYVDNIACLVKYHRKYNISDLSDDFLKGEKIRLPFLVSLLRLGDELDADCDRVNIDQLKLDNIPADSKFHWWCCLYVKSINIINGKIEVLFRFPNKYQGNLILDIIVEKVKKSIKAQIDEVYDVLDRYGLRLYKDVQFSFSYSSVAPDIPSDLENYLISKKKNGFRYL